MQSLVIRGKKPLSGEIRVSGSKNAVLPMLAATVAFRNPCRIRNCPELTDVDAALEILEFLGARTQRNGTEIYVNPRDVAFRPIPERLMGAMRGSLFFAGPLLARFGRCILKNPGGCPLGARPVDFHAMGFRALGAEADPNAPELFSGDLSGGEIGLPYPSVGATENLVMAALGASGTSVIRNAAREPEIVCLCDFLRSGGARIYGDGTPVITVVGGAPDSGDGTVIPDRMEAATFACACASAGGRIGLNQMEPNHLTSVLDVLERSGCVIGRYSEHITVEAGELISPGEITTKPYPGFPTDAQAPVMAALLRAEGVTRIQETVFSRRMHHVAGLRAMRGQIELRENWALIRGTRRLTGAAVEAEDLRGGGALAVAALGAEGESRIAGMRHILRGYEHFAEKLRTLGADAFPV